MYSYIRCRHDSRVIFLWEKIVLIEQKVKLIRKDDEFSKIANGHFLSSQNWQFRIKNLFHLTRACSNRLVVMTIQETLYCHTIRQKSATVRSVGPYKRNERELMTKTKETFSIQSATETFNILVKFNCLDNNTNTKDLRWIIDVILWFIRNLTKSIQLREIFSNDTYLE